MKRQRRVHPGERSQNQTADPIDGEGGLDFAFDEEMPDGDTSTRFPVPQVGAKIGGGKPILVMTSDFRKLEAVHLK